MLEVQESLDRESTPFYEVIVSASDGSQSSSATVIITILDINDEIPVFSQAWYTFDITEDTPTGVQVGQIIATDTDEGRNSELTYSILTHWGREHFSLHPHTGIITLIDDLNYEDVSD